MFAHPPAYILKKLIYIDAVLSTAQECVYCFKNKYMLMP
jgi:hypothetical protein